MGLYCCDNDGEFYSIPDFNALMEEVKKTPDVVKAMFQYIYYYGQIFFTLESLTEKGFVTRTADLEYTVEEINESILAFRNEVVKEYGEEAAKELEDEIDDIIAKASKNIS